MNQLIYEPVCIISTTHLSDSDTFLHYTKMYFM